MNPDGSNNRQLTFDSKLNPMLPTVSPDGRFIVFIGGNEESKQLWRLEIENGSLKQLTDSLSSEMISFLKFGSDGQTIFYGTFTAGLDASYIRKMSIEGGAPVEIRRIENAGSIGLSPDEKLVAFIPRSDEDTVFGIMPLLNEQVKPRYFTLQRYPFGVGYFLDLTADRAGLLFTSAKQTGRLTSKSFRSTEANPMTSLTSEMEKSIILSFRLTENVWPSREK